MSEEPPNKKIRTDFSSYINHEDEYLNRIYKATNNLKAIISDDINKDITLVKVYTGELNSMKDISNTINMLNKHFPLPNLKHLKRAKGKYLLLCLLDEVSSEEDLKDKLQNNLGEFDKFVKFSIEEVPLYPPKLAAQAKEFNKYWPISFHPNKYLEKLAGNSFFEPLELQNHRKFMCVALEVARFYHRNKFPNGDPNDEVNAAIVVDPRNLSVVAAAIDKSDIHPLKHASMIAIDNVAKTQNGGVWPSDCKPETNDRSGIEHDLKMYLTRISPDIVFGVESIEKSADNDLKSKPYLCTNYYVYMIREPCVMCSMALVHARASRVFFCFDNKEMGGLKSRTKLHCVQHLNHHYEVFTGFL